MRRMHKTRFIRLIQIVLLSLTVFSVVAKAQTPPDEIKFVRQGVQRMIFDRDQSIPLARLDPGNIIGMSVMHPASHYLENHSTISVRGDQLVIQSGEETRTGIWFGGFNPFATYSIDLASFSGEGEIGFEFSDAKNMEQFFIRVGFKESVLTGVTISVVKNSSVIADESIAVNLEGCETLKNRIILQMLGSGFTLYMQDKGLPEVIGQSDFNHHMDLRSKECIHSFQSHLFLHLKGGEVVVDGVEMALTTGVGLADIRAITFENGDPLLDQGRLWYTMSVRGLALPHHIQGVFSRPDRL